MWEQGHGLNLRPFPPALKHALRELATAAGQSLYAYTIQVLRQHVADHRRADQPAPAEEPASV